ncbi:MAG: ABC transporter ATP-binding protein [Deltaproteobacteria bacterium]|nr:ABC transporter ATP-binding protein [Deltaproteobacteria bacterium]
MIEVEGLTRKYGDLVAVDDVSFSIGKGEVVGLLGHNGAGKTTIMRMLTGYIEPTEGSVVIDGMPLSEARLGIQRKLGYLSENAPLYPDMSVVRYLEYVADLRGVPRAGRPAVLRRALERTWLLDRALDPVGTLSKGYKQRLGVAQAIVHEPEILILDEPTNGLDPTQIFQMRSLVRGLSENATIIVSTHILQEVEAVCERVIIMVQGRIAVDARMSELQQSHRLVVGLGNPSDDAPERLREIPGVAEVLPAEGPRGESYGLELDAPMDEVAPSVAREAVERGWDLYRMSEEARTLESVFREVGEGGGHDG